MEEEIRTIQQNKALHKWFELLAEALNDGGLDMKTVLKAEIEIPWTKDMIKEHLWKPIQKLYLKKNSTANLSKKDDIDKIFDIINRQIGEKWGIYVPFPSIERVMEEEKEKLDRLIKNNLINRKINGN